MTRSPFPYGVLCEIADLLINPVGTPVGALESRADLDTVKTLTQPAGSNAVVLQAGTQNVRVSIGATAPEVGLGFLLVAGEPAQTFPVAPGFTVRTIEVAPTAVLQMQWVRRGAV